MTTNTAFGGYPLGHPATTRRLDRIFGETRAEPDLHRCGKCGALAPLVDVSPHGTRLYVCVACHPKGHPTLVQP